MISFSTNTHDFRSKRKCFSMTACLIFVLLMSDASCRPSETADDVATYTDGDYTDADDFEWESLPIVETTTKDHPIIFYKEDIVSEDYDPNKEEKSSTKEQDTNSKPLHSRKYEEISRSSRRNNTEKYRSNKKVYFDVYPIEDDGAKDDDIKFNDDDIRVEVISLTDDNSQMSSDLKRLVNKRAKKFHRQHRHRREAVETAAHTLRHKRNYRNAFYRNQLPSYQGVRFPQVPIYKHVVKGIYTNIGNPSTNPVKNPIAFDNRIDDEPIWFTSPISPKPATTRRPRRPPPPIIRGGDEDFVPINSPTTTARPRQTTRRPQFESATAAPVFRPERLPQSTTRPPATSQQSGRNLSNCVWAIISCCNQQKNVRYQCFEREGCNGAFWDLNPCADDIIQKALDASDQLYNSS